MARRMKGEGSLYQTKEKTWVCQYYDTDGNRRTKRFQRKADGRAFLDGLKEPYAIPQNPGRPSSAEHSPSGPTISPRFRLPLPVCQHWGGVFSFTH